MFMYLLFLFIYYILGEKNEFKTTYETLSKINTRYTRCFLSF